MNLSFEHPRLLWLLLAFVPGVAFFYWWAWQQKRRLITRFVSSRLLANLAVGVSVKRQQARMALVGVAVILLIVALARPQLGFSWEEARSRGLDIVVAIDTSRSMLATDLTPDRLRRAQLAALDLKRLARTDRLGLVAFAGSAFLQCPLTLDDEAFRQSVEALDVNIIPQGGTALAEAIQAAQSAFKKGNDNHKVLVLLTDGEDHDGDALTAAKAAAKEGLSIFTVGVGTANGELLRVRDVQGRMEFIKDPDGNAVKSRLNETLLREIAQETGGFYLQLSGANAMNLLYERGLAPLPKADLASQRIKRPHERYQWLLGLALGLLLLEMCLPERKTAKSAAAKTVTAVTAGSATTAGSNLQQRAAVMIVLWLIASAAFASASPGKALKQYRNGQYDRSLEEYERLLKSQPDDARLHFNAGAAAFQNKDYEQALSHLNDALVSSDVGLLQRTYYNIGNAQYRLGEEENNPQKKQKLWEQSIKSFDSATTLDPRDNDATFNKEFVKRQLEALKKEQPPQPKEDQKDSDNQEKQDQKQQQNQGNNQQSKEQKDQQQQQQQEQQQNQQKEGQSQEEKQKEQQEQQEQQKQKDQAAKEDQQSGQEKKGQQNSASEEKGEPQDQSQGEPQNMASVKMTPQQAIRLLEAVKADEKLMPFRPVTRTNRLDRRFKDW